MRYLIRRHPLRPPISPPHLIAPSASRPASRRTVSPDGSAQGTTPSCPLLARSSCLLTHLVPSHRIISSAHQFRPLLACLVPSYRRRPLSSVPCCSSISSAPPHLIGSSPVPPRFPLCFPPSVPPHLFARLASSHRFISSHAPSDKMSRELTKRRT